jgi:hypothetical protein
MDAGRVYGYEDEICHPLKIANFEVWVDFNWSQG